MENASKALIMAAAVLIGVIILSLGVYLFVYFSSYSKNVNDEVKNNQISQFNGQFLAYNEKVKPIYNDDGSFKKNVGGLTIYDVITLANLAKEYNKDNGLKPGDKGFIKMTFLSSVHYSVSRNISTSPTESKENDIKEISNEAIYNIVNYELLPYSCKVLVDKTTLLVSEIQIIQK